MRERRGWIEKWTWDASLVECEINEPHPRVVAPGPVPVQWQWGYRSGLASHMKVTSWSFIDTTSKVLPCAQASPSTLTHGFPLCPPFYHETKWTSTLPLKSSIEGNTTAALLGVLFPCFGPSCSQNVLFYSWPTLLAIQSYYLLA